MSPLRISYVYYVIFSLILGLIAAWFYHQILAPLGATILTDAQSSAPLFKSSDRFMDFINNSNIPKYANDAAWAAPPFTHILNIILKQFSSITSTSVSLIIYTALGVILLFLSSKHWANSNNWTTGYVNIIILLLLILSLYPLHFVIDRGNWALWVVALCISGVASYLSGRTYLGILLLVFAASLKIIPLAFAVLFIYKRDWRGLLIFLGATLFIGMASYLYLLSVYNLPLNFILLGQYDYTKYYALGKSGLAFSSSLFSLVRIIAMLILDYQFPLNDAYSMALIKLPAVLQVYALIMVVSAIMLVLAAWQRKIPLAQLASLTAIWLALAPHVTGDYYLLFLIIPLIWVLGQPRQPKQSLALILLVLTLIPKHYFWLDPIEGVSSNVIINPLLLLGLYFCLMFRWQKNGDPGGI